MQNIDLQNGVRVRDGVEERSGIELGLDFNSAAVFLNLLHSVFCLTGLFKTVINILSTLRET